MKIFAQNHNNILNDLLFYYKKTTNLLESDVVITWNDLIQPQNRIVKLAKEYGKKSIIIEHGMKAVADYQHDLRDISNGMGGKPFIADMICVWGNKSKQIMLDAGVSEKKVKVIGSPIVWEHEYIYKKKIDDKIISVRFHGGMTITDPLTGDEWELQGCKSHIPQREPDGNIIAFFPGHRSDPYTLKKVRRVYNQIKHRKDVFVLLNENWIEKKPENPFLDLLNIKDEKERRDRCMFIPIDKPHNLIFIKSLLRRTKLAITVMPGTINGICWAMDVPVLVPKIDWHWRDLNGNIIYDIHSADYTCKENKINDSVRSILEKDTLKEERRNLAIDFMGVDRGNPTTNLREIIDNA